LGGWCARRLFLAMFQEADAMPFMSCSQRMSVLPLPVEVAGCRR